MTEGLLWMSTELPQVRLRVQARSSNVAPILVVSPLVETVWGVFVIDWPLVNVPVVSLYMW